MKEDIIRDTVRIILVSVLIAGLLYFLYPLFRYEYIAHGVDGQPVYRIDRFTGELSRLRPLGDDAGWHPVNNTKYQ